METKACSDALMTTVSGETIERREDHAFRCCVRAVAPVALTPRIAAVTGGAIGGGGPFAFGSCGVSAGTEMLFTVVATRAVLA